VNGVEARVLADLATASGCKDVRRVCSAYGDWSVRVSSPDGRRSGRLHRTEQLEAFLEGKKLRGSKVLAKAGRARR